MNELRDEVKNIKEIEESVNPHKQRLDELVDSGLLDDNYILIDLDNLLYYPLFLRKV